ncbi:MAG: hypothetical protein U0I09_02950 [Bacteroidaceae bacterium]|nr:hypothetical protein [Bacteroidaceae bacterium]
MKEKNAEISARIDEIICILHTNPNKFANALGYSRAQTIYDILEGKSAPSYDFFKRFTMSGYSVFINLRWLLSGEGNPIVEERYLESDLPIIKGEMTPEEAAQKLKEIKAKKQQPIANNQDPIINRILESMDKKDAIIKEQAEEIGQLRERIAQLQREKGKNASDAQTSDIANVG